MKKDELYFKIPAIDAAADETEIKRPYIGQIVRLNSFKNIDSRPAEVMAIFKFKKKAFSFLKFKGRKPNGR